MSGVKEELDSWRSLVGHPKWKELVRIGEEQKAARLSGLLNGLDNIREEDKIRGEYLGIGLILCVPETQVATLSVELDNMQTEE